MVAVSCSFYFRPVRLAFCSLVPFFHWIHPLVRCFSSSFVLTLLLLNANKLKRIYSRRTFEQQQNARLNGKQATINEENIGISSKAVARVLESVLDPTGRLLHTPELFAHELVEEVVQEALVAGRPQSSHQLEVVVDVVNGDEVAGDGVLKADSSWCVFVSNFN